MKTRIAIFASGGGSNAGVILDYFKNSAHGEIALIVSNKKEAYVLERAVQHNVPTFVHTKADRIEGKLATVLKDYEIDFVVLAGYLQKIEPDLIEMFPNRIVNIHPALLPKYGGKGMYGMHVHRAVVAANETESGITIHYVNENYDEGNIIAQFSCSIETTNTAEDVQKKVLKLEHTHFAKTIHTLIEDLNKECS